MASQAEQPSLDRWRRPAFQAHCEDPFVGVTRNNGVVFKAIDRVPLHEYLDSFATSLPDKHVISASHISNNRIAVYLRSREDVADAVASGLAHDGSFLPLFPLVQPTTRLTLSKVFPEIPNAVAAHNISDFCKIVSSIRPIPLGLKHKQLSHVMSFRRQVQVQVQVLLNPGVAPPVHINFTYTGLTTVFFFLPGHPVASTVEKTQRWQSPAWKPTQSPTSLPPQQKNPVL